VIVLNGSVLHHPVVFSRGVRGSADASNETRRELDDRGISERGRGNRICGASMLRLGPVESSLSS
jgi:hypothetical protein